jgi:hypothetical protein
VILGVLLIVSSLLAGNDLPAIFNAIRNRSWNITQLLADKHVDY